MKDEATGAGSVPRNGEASADDVGVSPPGYRLPASVRLGPVHLQVADLARSEEFYGRVLGLTRLDPGPEDGSNGGVENEAHGRGSASLGVSGGKEPLLELVEKPGATPVPRRGRLALYHFALRVPDRVGLARVARRLRDLDVRVGMADHKVSEALYLADPDGLGIEVYRDRPRREWRTEGGQIVMATDPLDLEGLLEEGPGDSSDGVPPGTVMGHVHLHVGDLEEAARFYHDALGFDKVVWSYPGALFLSAGGYHHHLGVNTWAAPARPPGADEARLLHWSLVVPDATEVAGITESVRGAGYSVVDGESHGAPVRLADPWGTELAVLAAAP